MESHPNRGKLMWASFLTLIAAGIGFAIRGGILTDWGNQFGFTQSELGTITGGGLMGFGIVILIASQITDRLGYKPILLIACVLHVLSVVVTLAATPIYHAGGKNATFQCLYWGMFSTGNKWPVAARFHLQRGVDVDRCHDLRFW